MKQKKVIIIAMLFLVIIMGATIAFARFSDVRSPVTENPQAITYKDDNLIKTETQNTDPDVDKQVDESEPQQPTFEVNNNVEMTEPEEVVTNSPKQSAIRQSIEKNYVYHPLVTANDPAFLNNWAIQKVKAPEAWDISTGNGQTVVAVIDTGFALEHEDLKDTWFNNVSEIGMTSVTDRCWSGVPEEKSNNYCDDDNNGYIDDWQGWNFLLGDNNPMTGRTNPNGGAASHGTEVAGLTGAAGNNATGITTINWQTKIMPLQVLSDDGPGYTSDVVAAVYYAVDNGADVINMSLGGNEYDAPLKDATDYAFDNGVVVVAAAGNCGTGTESGCGGYPAGHMGYPALNDHVISVGATNYNDQRASFSSYGPGLDIVAPGSGSIVSPTWTPTNATSLYATYLHGTSYASPQVASLVSLIKSIRPNSSVNDITALILATTSKPSAMNASLYTNTFGHGIINAFSSLTVATSLNSTNAIPELMQEGGAVAEHIYKNTDTLGSGCIALANAYCTIWLRDHRTGYERYLPYNQTNQLGQTGWTWSGSLIPSASWQVWAIQGDNKSTNNHTLTHK